MYIIFATSKHKGYDSKFQRDYLRDLYRSGKSDKKHRFQPQIVRKYIRVIDLMISEDNVQGLWKYNSLNYERLEGNKEGLSSVRVNDQYRIEFEEEFEDGKTIDELLAAVPSVDVNSEGEISLRGNADVLVWINGKKMGMNDDNRAQILRQLPAEAIESIEVMTNPSSKHST